MAKLYVFYINHVDLTWRRPRYNYGHYDGYIIRPYTELQEKEIETALDFIRKGGNYNLEQSLSLREYLEHNPDAYPEVRQMIADGKLNVLGGGESVIDYNLPNSETIVRNHMYSLRWLKSEFGVRPKFAECCDTFGLSGGLPALFSDLGYEGITRYSRVFAKAKPFWRGISGDIIPLGTSLNFKNMPILDFAGYVAHCASVSMCDVCHGEGCPACENLGAFTYYSDYFKNEQAIKDFVEEVKEASKKNNNSDVCLTLDGEEFFLVPECMDVLKRVAEMAGMNLHPIGLEKFTEIDKAELLKTYRSGNIPEEDIDSRQEGNSVTTGCYTTRIKLKQALRKCEAALLACERLAVAAQKEKGELYPVKTIEVLWRKLSFLYFHDAAPASHSDDAYDELMDIARQVFTKANYIINRSIAILTQDNSTDNSDGYSFIVYNPLEFDVKNVRLQGVVAAAPFIKNGKVVDADGNSTDILSIKHSNITKLAYSAVIDFYGDLPAFGYKVFRFVPEENSSVQKETDCRDAVLENKYLCVTFKDYMIKSVVDKTTGAVIADTCTFDPVVSDDAGNPWGRTAIGCYNDDAIHPCFYLNMIPPHEHTRYMETESFEGVKRVTVKVRYSRPDRHLNMLDWKAEFELPDNSPELHVNITASLDARDIRLSTQVILPSQPKNDELEYSIPFGKIKRGKATYQDIHGYADEWPALHYVCAELDNVNVLLCNSGTPACKLNGNTLTTALIRTPTQALYAFDTDGAIDTTEHHFTFTLSAPADRDLTPYRAGATLNAFYPALKGALSEAKGKYITFDLPDNAPLLALKGAEDGNGYIVRYSGLENKEALVFKNPVQITNVLEEAEGKTVTEAELPPFAIRSFRIK